MELERKKNLLHAKLLAVQSKQQEEELHASLPDSLRKVLGGKRLIVWQKLLEKFGYDDMAVVKFMLEGVPIVGSTMHQHATLRKSSRPPARQRLAAERPPRLEIMLTTSSRLQRRRSACALLRALLNLRSR